MVQRQWLTLQQVLNEIFLDPLIENDGEDDLEEEYRDSVEYSIESDEEFPIKVTNTRNESVRSTSNQSFGFHRTVCAGLRGWCSRIPGSFAPFLWNLLNITIKSLRRILI